MCQRIRTINKFRSLNPICEKMISGFHIEGPFLNESPGYIGAHPSSYAIMGYIDDTKRLLDSANGLTKIITLAPERDPHYKVTSMLSGLGITVFTVTVINKRSRRGNHNGNYVTHLEMDAP